jgi:hypothetical protein
VAYDPQPDSECYEIGLFVAKIKTQVVVGCCFKNQVSGLYVHSIWNISKGGIAGNKTMGATGIFIGKNGCYPNQLHVSDQGMYYSRLQLTFKDFCIDYYVPKIKVKIMDQRGKDKHLLGLFISPKVEGDWKLFNDTENTIYCCNVFVTEKVSILNTEDFYFRLRPFGVETYPSDLCERLIHNRRATNNIIAW